ncbi:hypothetical protein GGF50DRAFT_28807, partial [Schizophyllum commune]
IAPAMALCHLNIKRDIVYSCTLRKMVYAYKHGYTEFMDAIAENSLEESPKDALSAFGPGALFIGWVLYKDAWAEILRASHKWRDLNNHGLPGVKCEAWTSVLYECELGLEESFWRRSPSMIGLRHKEIADKCKHRHDSGATQCRVQLDRWVRFRKKQINAIPPLSRFISHVQS